MARPLSLLWLFVGVFLFTASAYPHGGGLDGYGCHHNRKAGGYHCHRGELAGESFTSKEEMLKKLNRQTDNGSDNKEEEQK